MVLAVVRRSLALPRAVATGSRQPTPRGQTTAQRTQRQRSNNPTGFLVWRYHLACRGLQAPATWASDHWIDLRPGRVQLGERQRVPLAAEAEGVVGRAPPNKLHEPTRAFARGFARRFGWLPVPFKMSLVSLLLVRDARRTRGKRPGLRPARAVVPDGVNLSVCRFAATQAHARKEDVPRGNGHNGHQRWPLASNGAK